ncbi:MAG TPA: hypothetical protein V6C72_09010 [Chroococcales cyanobacterium]
MRFNSREANLTVKHYSPPQSSVRVQRSAVYYGVVKAANTIGYFWLMHLTWRFCTHRLDWQLSTGCVVISAFWLILTRIKVDHLLQTYFDILSRLELQLPVFLGIAMSVVALMSQAIHPYFHLFAVLEIFGWMWIYWLYKRNQALFKKQGFGPVPLNTWVSPPLSILRPGDLLLTSGNVARNLHESVGHAETVIETESGERFLLSSYMKKGAILRPIEQLLKQKGPFYFVALHLHEPLDQAAVASASRIAHEMVAANRAWAARENEKIGRIVDLLPLSADAKARLRKRFHVTGYDWFGMFMGRLAPDRWTCIGAALELYKRLGIRTNYYGTGLLGFGTTLFDPILPVRFLADPAFDLVTLDEQKDGIAAQSLAPDTVH